MPTAPHCLFPSVNTLNPLTVWLASLGRSGAICPCRATLYINPTLFHHFLSFGTITDIDILSIVYQGKGYGYREPIYCCSLTRAICLDPTTIFSSNIIKASLHSTYSVNAFDRRLIVDISPLGALRFGSQRYALILRYLVPISHYVSCCKKIKGNYFSKVNRNLCTNILQTWYEQHQRMLQLCL